MKKIVEVSPEESGLMSLIGETVTLFCCRYIYTGKLVGINDSFVMLEDPQIVYNTGAFDEAGWADAQKLPKKEWFVMLGSIESYGILK